MNSTTTHDYGKGITVLASRPASTRKKPEKRCEVCHKLKCVTEFGHDKVGVLNCKSLCHDCENARWRFHERQRKLARRRVPPENVGK